MVQDTGLDFAAGPTAPTLLSSDLADGSKSAWTASVNFGAPTPLGFGWELVLTTLTGCVNFCGLEVAWSHDNSTFSDDDNPQQITSVKCTASTDKQKVSSSAVMAQYAKFRLNNNSGGSIDGTSSNTAFVFTDIFYNHAND